MHNASPDKSPHSATLQKIAPAAQNQTDPPDRCQTGHRRKILIQFLQMQVPRKFLSAVELPLSATVMRFDKTRSTGGEPCRGTHVMYRAVIVHRGSTSVNHVLKRHGIKQRPESDL